jgi:apolipoprotein N-acyltransferase
MKRYLLVALSVTGGILSGLAWSSWCSGLILLVSLVPFLLIENHLYVNSDKYSPNAYFVYLIPGLVIFNIISLGWVKTASIPAAIAVITGLAFLMGFVLWLAHLIRLRAGNLAGSLALVFFWLAFEYLSLNTIFLSPWANLGNGLAKDIIFIQWYEVTGTAGGTLWILCSNLFLGIFIINFQRTGWRKRIYLWIWIGLILIPSLISVTRYLTVRQSDTNCSEVVIIQPDFDPYTEKFSIPFEEQLNKVLAMAGETFTEKTKWVLTPETTVDDPVNEDFIKDNKYIKALNEFTGRHQGVNVIAGMESSRTVTGSDFLSADSRPGLSEYYNSAFHFNSKGVTGIYHKSKLVPGFEMQFAAGFGKMIRKILPDFGGSTWGYSVQDERFCFRHSETGQIAGPVICYESVFGNYVADYVRKGAQVLFIITNDGWWKNTNGYKQHLSYASLRAIETRRPVARAANTGISCFIDIRGRRTMETKWWTETAIKGDICSETRITPYVRYGDYILKLSSILSAAVLLFVLVLLPLKRNICN